jgi:hypothetical protein
MLTTIRVLAVNNFGDTRSGGLAGPMALLIIVLLGIATVLLIRNMNARLRRLPAEFPEQSGNQHSSDDPQALRDRLGERGGASVGPSATATMRDGAADDRQ